jgi:hypothetical protein
MDDLDHMHVRYELKKFDVLHVASPQVECSVQPAIPRLFCSMSPRIALGKALQVVLIGVGRGLHMCNSQASGAGSTALALV